MSAELMKTNFYVVNMGPYASQNFKPLLLLQIAADIFQASSQWSSQNYD